MAKFVIAGKSNCPYYAKAEFVGDQLARNLPNFRVHKVLISPDEWENWLEHICKINSWKHKKSPIIWRELLDRGGPAKLIGDANDFQEYAKVYYGINSTLTSDDLTKISFENDETFQIIERERLEEIAKIKPFIITISHASSRVAYHIIPKILSSHVFKSYDDITLRLYERNHMFNLNGIKMEIEDFSASNLRYIEVCKDEHSAFLNCDLVVILDELDDLDIKKSDLKPPIIGKYYNPYIVLAKAIDQYAKQECKILISPFEFHHQTFGLVTLFIKNLKRLNGKECVIGNSLHYEFIAKSILAKRLQVSPFNIRDVIVIGQGFQQSHYTDIAQSKVTGYEGAIWARSGTHWRSVVEMVADTDWMQKEFPTAVSQRENEIKDLLGRNGIFSFSQSIVMLLELWFNENNSDDMLHSAIVFGDGHYFVKNGLCISLPVVFKSGRFTLDTYFKTNSEVLKIFEEIVNESEKSLEDRFEGDIFNLIDTSTPPDTPLPNGTVNAADELENNIENHKERENLHVEFDDNAQEEFYEENENDELGEESVE